LFKLRNIFNGSMFFDGLPSQMRVKGHDLKESLNLHVLGTYSTVAENQLVVPRVRFCIVCSTYYQ
jgi:hypothetical protein